MRKLDKGQIQTSFQSGPSRRFERAKPLLPTIFLIPAKSPSCSVAPDPILAIAIDCACSLCAAPLCAALVCDAIDCAAPESATVSEVQIWLRLADLGPPKVQIWLSLADLGPLRFLVFFSN